MCNKHIQVLPSEKKSYFTEIRAADGTDSVVSIYVLHISASLDKSAHHMTANIQKASEENEMTLLYLHSPFFSEYFGV